MKKKTKKMKKTNKKEITKKQFTYAQKTVVKYIIQKNKSQIKNHVCICCKEKEIKPLEGYGLSEGMIDERNQEQGVWNGGTVEKISFGFGSKHDCNAFYVAICDDCIEKLAKEGIVKSLGNKEFAFQAIGRNLSYRELRDAGLSRLI